MGGEGEHQSFFGITDTQVPAKANVVLTLKSVDNWKIPFYTNNKVVNEGDLLQIFKAAPEKDAKLKDATIEDDGATAEPVAKRARGRGRGRRAA